MVTNPDPSEMVERYTLRVSATESWDGGQGEIAHCAHVDGCRYLFKRYKPDKLDEVRPAELLRMVDWRRSLGAPEREALDARFAWPIAMVTESGRAIGFIMHATGDEFLSKRTDSSQVEPWHLSNAGRSREGSKRAGLPYHPPPVRLAIAGSLVQATIWLHRHGYCVGDLQPENALYHWDEQTREARCYVVDCDSCLALDRSRGVLEIAQPEPWKMPDTFTHNRTTDYYKLGWLVVRLLHENLEQNDIDEARMLAMVDRRTLELVRACCRGEPPAAVESQWERTARLWATLASTSPPRARIGDGRLVQWGVAIHDRVPASVPRAPSVPPAAPVRWRPPPGPSRPAPRPRRRSGRARLVLPAAAALIVLVVAVLAWLAQQGVAI